MRLKPEIKAFIKETSAKMFPGTDVYLFGSRVDNNARGGDIDLLLISENKLNNRELRLFRIDFYKRFGWQKIDLINFTKNDDSVFKAIAVDNAEII